MDRRCGQAQPERQRPALRDRHADRRGRHRDRGGGPVTWQQVFIVGLLVVPALGALLAVLMPRRALAVGVAASGLTLLDIGTLLLSWLNQPTKFGFVAFAPVRPGQQ